MPPAHASWPILAFGPGRAQLFEADRVLEYAGPIGFTPRESLLEELDASITERSTESMEVSRGSRPQVADRLKRIFWEPADRELRDFLRACGQRARAMGGLRLVSRESYSPPVESLAVDGEWSRDFPILRMHAQDASLAATSSEASRNISLEAAGAGGSAEDESSEWPQKRRALRKLVWFNPAGEVALPAARREAEAIFAIMQEYDGPARFVGRTLGDHEWYELYDSHDLVFYYGHGQSVAGHPVIDTKNGRAPFFAPTGAGPSNNSGRCLVFAACLAGGEQTYFRNQSGAILYPVCRLADRPSAFLADFSRSLLAGRPAPLAVHAAARADADRGDVRRFIFRLQGAGDFG